MDEPILEPDYRPEQVLAGQAGHDGRPINYPVYERSHHFRLKVQEFPGMGYEATVSCINLQRFVDRQMLMGGRGPRTERKGDEDSLKKSQLRSRKMVRYKAKCIGADHLLTLTTRATLTIDELLATWQRFVDRLEYVLGEKLAYVCVPEPHPSNPDHYHLHAAVRGRVNVTLARRLWYLALGGRADARKGDTPGNIDAQYIKVPGGSRIKRAEKIARYISKYVTKALVERFNKKRYWSTKVDLPAARTYWLKGATFVEALNESFNTLGVFVCSGKDLFIPRGMDLAWWRVLPGDIQEDLSGTTIGTVPF